ncbi:MAG: SRPBCC domain-containing protein [Chitinophagaceae bacterium]|nr:MAG: SRPBCC domain-containing protein [Chitinophagaceae bacterium]
MNYVRLVHIIEINASADKVWDALWLPENYQIWTVHFVGGSVMKSDWTIGGRIYFLRLNGDGLISSILSKNKPYGISFSHLGLIKNGVESLFDKTENPEFLNACETYELNEVSGVTTLKTASFVSEDYIEMFQNGFVKGFQIVKEIAENS